MSQAVAAGVKFDANQALNRVLEGTAMEMLFVVVLICIVGAFLIMRNSHDKKNGTHRPTSPTAGGYDAEGRRVLNSMVISIEGRLTETSKRLRALENSNSRDHAQVNQRLQRIEVYMSRGSKGQGESR